MQKSRKIDPNPVNFWIILGMIILMAICGIWNYSHVETIDSILIVDKKIETHTNRKCDDKGENCRTITNETHIITVDTDGKDLSYELSLHWHSDWNQIIPGQTRISFTAHGIRKSIFGREVFIPRITEYKLLN